MLNDAEYKAFEIKFAKLEELIESYSANHEYCIALSLSFNFYTFGYMCPVFEDYAANKITPLNEFHKQMFRRYMPINEDKSEGFLFKAEKVIDVLDEIIKTVSSDYKLLLEEAIMIYSKYSKDGRFVRVCNECYLEVKKEIESDFEGFEIGGDI